MKKRAASRPAAPTSKQLAAALRAQADGVFLARPKPRSPGGLEIVFANESFCRMTGRDAGELAGLVHTALHADPTDLSKLARWLRSPGRPFTGEGYLLRSDGSTIYAAWSYSAVRDERRRVSEIVATYRDTTEKRRLQEALVHSQRLDAVGRLAGGVAHDFNNLLSVINGYCEMLAAQVSDRPQALREVNEIHKAGLRAATLTRQLLAFGRRQPMNPRVLNLNRVVRDNAEIMSRLIGKAGRLELDLATNLSNVRADATQLQQVLLNLVINARDALRSNGCITLSTSNRDVKLGLNRRATDIPPGRYVCLSVSDNGTGMDAETQKHLFEPFFTTKPEGKGTGLGLALVYGIVQQSHGYINVRSAVLVGSTFEILLPETKEREEDQPSLAAVTPLPATRGHETIVFIESDEIVRKMVTGMLTADGYRIVSARTPAEAIRLAGEQDRAVELLITPADEPAERAARKLHQRHANLRILRIGHHDTPAPFSWLPAKRQAGLAKPYALSEVLRCARALLDA